MPRSDQFSAILDYVIPHDAEFMRWKVRRLSEHNRLEPELSEGAIALHVNVRRLVAFVTEEEEPVRTDAQNRRQSPLMGGASAASEEAKPTSESAGRAC